MQKKILIVIFLVVTLSCSRKKPVDSPVSLGEPETVVIQVDTATFREMLEGTKQYYPFDYWKEMGKNGMEQYTVENCMKTQKVFDILIDGLISLGPNGTEQQKVELFKQAVLSLNQLNSQIYGLIETGERESLCDLVNRITDASGLNPAKYANGEGLADLWRDW